MDFMFEWQGQYRSYYCQRRQKQSRAGGGAASRKRAPYFTLADKQKSLTLKNSLSLLNLYDWKMDCHGTQRVVHLCFR